MSHLFQLVRDLQFSEKFCHTIRLNSPTMTYGTKLGVDEKG